MESTHCQEIPYLIDSFFKNELNFKLIWLKFVIHYFSCKEYVFSCRLHQFCLQPSLPQLFISEFCSLYLSKLRPPTYFYYSQNNEKSHCKTVELPLPVFPWIYQIMLHFARGYPSFVEMLMWSFFCKLVEAFHVVR